MNIQPIKKLPLLEFICVIVIITINIAFLLYTLKVLSPYLGLGVKNFLMAKIDKLPDIMPIRSFKRHLEKKKRAKQNWKILIEYIDDFIKMYRNPLYSNINPQVLFRFQTDMIILKELKTSKKTIIFIFLILIFYEYIERYTQLNERLIEDLEEKILENPQYNKKLVQKFYKKKLKVLQKQINQ